VASPSYGRLQPRPVIHVAGEKDPLVKFAWQKLMIEELRRINQCGDGRPAGPWCTVYDSKVGAPVMTYIHPGGHEFPSEATKVVVDFFKNHPKS
jgi:polyhydroxybutyrate depolymerase